ncbi:MAG: LemA family protein [Alistipes sp.]|nr:LemA family protein [Alistipes sp.]
MKRTTWIILAVVAVVALLGFSTYNSLARAEQEVAARWANVETQYQRRADLIPNLVNTVKGYAKHEQQTLEEVVAARAAATSVGSADFAKYVEAQQGVTAALGRLIAISESYPDLKANQNFLELQAQLEGTENRIAVARNEYNEAVKAFNIKTVTFPSNIIAKLFGYTSKSLFTASPSSEQAPVVAF